MANEFESVKIKKPIVERVRANKVKTGVPVNTFFEQAATEKLDMAVGIDSYNKTGNMIFKKARVVKKKKQPIPPSNHR